MTGVPAIAEVRLKGGPRSGQGFSMADWQTQILAALRMSRRTPDGPGWALGYRPTGNGSEWVWADGELCQSADRFDPELLRPYGAQVHDTETAELAEAS
jgi:hypothetical protein